MTPRGRVLATRRASESPVSVGVGTTIAVWVRPSDYKASFGFRLMNAYDRPAGGVTKSTFGSE